MKGRILMKNGKKPTVKQRRLMCAWGLNAENWLVERDTPAEMVVVHRHSDKTRTIPKKEDEE
jgi:hypothetical protein